MPEQLIQEAIQQAADSAPAVQAAALVHVARVLAVFDKAEAVHILERGIALADTLPEKDRLVLMPEVIATAAAVSPNRALELYASSNAGDAAENMVADRIAMTMIDHGHIAEAARYLSVSDGAERYPFLALGNALAHCKEDRQAQQAALRGAMAALRQDFAKSHSQQFLQVFDQYWKILPTEEAAAFVREFVDWILRQPDERGSYSFGYPGREFSFGSTQQYRLFEILGPLSRLDPQRAESLIQQYPELAKAAAIFPHGQHEGLAEIPMPEPTPKVEIPSGLIEWDPVKLTWIPVSEWMKTCWEDLFKQAVAQFDADTAARNPNRAPHEVWPSTQSFRQLMYRAGRYEGRGAVARLRRIPDLSVRLLAKIELIAGLLGLQMLGYSTRPPTPLSDQLSDDDKELESPDLASLPLRWEGLGKVRKTSIAIANWDPARRDWASPRHLESSTFRPDGQLSVRASALASVRCRYDSNGRLSDVIVSREGYPQKPFTCEYDDRGRLIRVSREIDPPQPEVPDPFAMMMSSSTWYETRVSPEGSHVVNPVTVAIHYDDDDRPIEISYIAEGGMSCTIIRTWNAAGLLETESVAPGPMGDLPPIPASVHTSIYDTRGRRVEFKSLLHGTDERRDTYLYDDHGNMVEAAAPEQHQRFEYDYDAHGNWTQRVTWSCIRGEMEYHPICIERRTIEYTM